MGFNQYRSNVRLNATSSSTGFIGKEARYHIKSYSLRNFLPSRYSILSTLLIISFSINLYFFLLNKDIVSKLAISELNSQKQDLSCEKQVSIQKLDIKENQIAAFMAAATDHDEEKRRLLEINREQVEQLRILHDKISEERNERLVMKRRQDAEIRAHEEEMRRLERINNETENPSQEEQQDVQDIDSFEETFETDQLVTAQTTFETAAFEINNQTTGSFVDAKTENSETGNESDDDFNFKDQMPEHEIGSPKNSVDTTDQKYYPTSSGAVVDTTVTSQLTEEILDSEEVKLEILVEEPVSNVTNEVITTVGTDDYLSDIKLETTAVDDDVNKTHNMTKSAAIIDEPEIKEDEIEEVGDSKVDLPTMGPETTVTFSDEVEKYTTGNNA